MAIPVQPFTPQRVVQQVQQQKVNPWAQVAPNLVQALVGAYVTNKLQGNLENQRQKQEMLAKGYTWDEEKKTWIPPAIQTSPVGNTGQSAVTWGDKVVGMTSAPKHQGMVGWEPDFDVAGHKAYRDTDGEIKWQKVDKPDERVSVQLPGTEPGTAGPVLDVQPSQAADIYMKIIAEKMKRDPSLDLTASKLLDDTRAHYATKRKVLDTKYGVGGMTFNPASPPKEWLEEHQKLAQEKLNDFATIRNLEMPSWFNQGVDPRKVEYETQASDFINSVLK